MKSAPWQSSCRAVQDRRTAQANSRHVQRLMNVKPSIDMRKPKALKYKRSRKNKQTVADVSTQEDHKTEYRTIIATTPNTTTKCTTIQNTYQFTNVVQKNVFGFRFFNCQFRNKITDLLIFSLLSTNNNPYSQKARQQQIQRDNNRMLRNLLEVDPSRRAERKQRFSR